MSKLRISGGELTYWNTVGVSGILPRKIPLTHASRSTWGDPRRSFALGVSP
ncbi:MAG: hypothetical protein RM347_013755 [Nostoc sp. ChiQUE02]|uniref:hypothetical protein n=1 Tax=Nostoc sp. ChiQUE02 TaxID=3075377 RepID=UPI003D161D26